MTGNDLRYDVSGDYELDFQYAKQPPGIDSPISILWN